MPAFPFHKQDCDEHCGPACLMMLLAHRGVPLQGLFQSDLKTIVRQYGAASSLAWESPPPAVEAVANQYLQNAPRVGLAYELYPAPGDPEPDDATLARTIQECLDATKNSPVFVLTESGGHWILIYDWVKSRQQFKVRSPSSLRLDCNDQVDHDAAGGRCKVCGRGRNKVMSPEELFLTFNNIISDDPLYDGKRVMVVPRLIPGVTLT